MCIRDSYDRLQQPGVSQPCPQHSSHQCSQAGQRHSGDPVHSSHRRSDTDPQILIHIAFLNTVKVHHLRIKAKDDGTGPRKVKVFSNRINMGFSDAEEQKADQEFTLMPKDYSTDIELKYVKFQRVDRLTVLAFITP
eukprot:TRINITY_DN6515_c0_g1_i5.p1 TRINITY_DN6515_c0_g1~~TRINITY_DN6515_c0_g1_i5.p1  ORF type:complete len:146 (+),score=13.80 TRINITY_DN6515_c0_g1_i5:28-438(+)